MSALILNTTLTSEIENKTNSYGIAEDHNDYTVTLQKGYRYSFDVETNSEYTNIQGLLQHNKVNISIKEPGSSLDLNERDGLQIDTTIAGSTRISFIADKSGDYTLDIFGKAGYENTTETGESDRIDIPYTLTSVASTEIVDRYVDNLAEAKLEENLLSFDKTNTAQSIAVVGNDYIKEGSSYIEITNTSLHHSIYDVDYFSFVADVTKDYIISVITPDGIYKNITMYETGYKEVVVGQNGQYIEQQYFTPSQQSDETHHYASFKVDGGKGDYTVRIDEAEIDPEQNTFVTEANMSVGVKIDASIYSRWDQDYFKIDGLEEGEIYRTTLISEDLFSQKPDYHIEINKSLDSDKTTAIEWYGNERRTENGIQSYSVADSDGVFNIAIKPHWETFAGDYSLIVEKIEDETLNSIVEINADKSANQVWLTEDVVKTASIKENDKDFFAVNMDKAGTYSFYVNDKAICVTASITDLEIYSEDGKLSTEVNNWYNDARFKSKYTNFNDIEYSKIKEGYLFDGYSNKLVFTIDEDEVGTYYIGTSKDSDATIEYDLHYEYTLHTDNDTDSFDTLLEAIENTQKSSDDNTKVDTVKAGEKITSSFNNSFDKDWYSINLTAGETYKIEYSSDDMYNVQLKMMAPNGEEVVNRDRIGDILTNVIEKVQLASGDNMQKSLDFLEDANIERFIELTDTIKENSLFLTGDEREEYSMYVQLVYALNGLSDDSMSNSSLTNMETGAIKGIMYYYGDELNTQYQSLEDTNYSIKYSPENVGLSVISAIKEINGFAKELKETSIKAKEITNTDIANNIQVIDDIFLEGVVSGYDTYLDNQKVLTNSLFGEVKLYNQYLWSKQTLERAQIEISKYKLEETDNLFSLMTKSKNLDNYLATDKFVQDNEIGGIYVSHAYDDADTGYTAEVTNMYIYTKDDKSDQIEVFPPNDADTFAVYSFVSNIDVSMFNGKVKSYFIKTITKDDDSSDVTTEIVGDNSRGIILNDEVAEVTTQFDIVNKIATEFAAIVDVNKVGDTATTLEKLTAMNNLNQFKTLVESSNFSLTSAQETSYDDLLSELTYTLITNEIVVLNDKTYDTSTSSDILFNDIETLVEILNISKISSFNDTEKADIVSSLSTTKDTLSGLFDTTMLNSKVAEYITSINDSTTTNEELIEIYSAYNALDGINEYTPLKLKSDSLIESTIPVTTIYDYAWGQLKNSDDEYNKYTEGLKTELNKFNIESSDSLLTQATKMANLESFRDSQYILKNGIINELKLTNTMYEHWAVESMVVTISDQDNTTDDIVVEVTITDDNKSNQYFTVENIDANSLVSSEVYSLGYKYDIVYTELDDAGEKETHTNSNNGVWRLDVQDEVATVKATADSDLSNRLNTEFTTVVDSVNTNSTVYENIMAMDNLVQFKNIIEGMGSSLTTAQQASYDGQLAKTTYTLLTDEITLLNAKTFDDTLSSADIFKDLETIYSILDISKNEFTDTQNTDIINSLHYTEIKVLNLLTVDMISDKITQYSTALNDTNSTDTQTIEAYNGVELLKNIVPKVDPTTYELLKFNDSYQEDLLADVTTDDFNALIDAVYGSASTSWWSSISESKGESFKINETGTYYFEFDQEYFNREAGEYDFTVLSINTSDVGATIADAGDFKLIDLEDHTSTGEQKTLTDNAADSDLSNDTKVVHQTDGIVKSLFNSNEDKDMFKYLFEAGKIYDISTDGTGLKFYTADGERINTSYNSILQKNWADSFSSYKFTPNEDTYYYIEVSKNNEWGSSGKEDYELKIIDTTKGDLAGSILETAAVYKDTIVDDNTKKAFNIDYMGDADWFKIDTHAGNYYNIDLTSDTDFFKVVIFNENGKKVFSEEELTMQWGTNMDEMDIDMEYTMQNWDTASQVSWNLYASLNTDGENQTVGHTYYVGVYNYANTGTYNLVVEEDTTSDDYGSTMATSGNFREIDGIDHDSDDSTALVYDNTIDGNFNRRNDKDWISYNWEKAIYNVVLDSDTVDKYQLSFFNEYDSGILSVDWAFDIRDNFVANRADTDGSSKNYIVTSKYSSISDAMLELKNTFGAGDYTLEIEKIADLDTTSQTISLDAENSYTNSSDEIKYQTDTSKYYINTQANKTYQIELSATDTEKAKLGQLLIEIKDIKGNIVDVLKEWNPTDVMTRAVFTPTQEGSYSIEIKTANTSSVGEFNFKIKELDLSGDIGSTLTNHGDFNELATDGVVSSDLNPSIDKDWFQYTFDENSQYLISVKMDNSETGLVHIYDSEGNIYKADQMWDTNNSLATSDKTILFNPGKTGEFYIEVSGVTQDSYKLEVKTYTDDEDIAASVDTTTSVTVDNNTAVTSLIDNKDDKDWIKVTLEAGKVYKIETTPAGDKMPMPLDLVINGIFDNAGTLIEGTASINGVQYIKPATNGTYYIEVAGKNDTLGYYDIKVTQDVTDDNQTINGEVIENHTINTNLEISARNMYTGKIDYLFDKDWIKVTLEAGKTYDINMTGNSLQDTHITGIYKADGTSLNLSNNDANSYTLDSKITMTIPGVLGDAKVDYFIEASGYGDLKGTYTVAVSENTEDITEGLSETLGNDVNNTVNNAIDGLMGRYQYGEINYGTDTDLYSYEFEAGVTYEINMYGTDSNLGTLSNSFISSIRDSGGVEIAGYSNAHGGNGNDSYLSFTAGATGTYYIETASQYNAQGSFKLNVKEEGDNLGGVAPIGDGSHTMMVYLGGDNNLEQYMVDDLIEMQLGSLPEGWNVTFLIDRAEGYDTRFGDWTDTRQGIIKFADLDTVDIATAQTEILSGMESLGELNTGDGQTLTNFINWSAQMASADSYSLIMSNHGGGVTGSVWDDASGHDNIKIAELTEAIEASTIHQAVKDDDTKKAFEMIGFDTCLQGVIDQQYALKDVTNVVLASEEISWSNFWDYGKWFDDIKEFDDNNGDAGVTGADMATLYVDMLRDWTNAGYNDKDTTMSAVNTELLDEVVEATAALNASFANIGAADMQRIKVETENSIIFSGETQLDLGAFAQLIDDLDINNTVDTAAQAVKSAVSNAVISNFTNMSGNGGDATGIAIHYNGGTESSGYMDNFELADMMNMHEFFEVV